MQIFPRMLCSGDTGRLMFISLHFFFHTFFCEGGMLFSIFNIRNNIQGVICLDI